MKRLSVLIAGVVLLLGSLAGTAAASSTGNLAKASSVSSHQTGGRETSSGASAATKAQLAAAAAVCATGDVCFWTGKNFSDSKCEWSNADNDWQVAPVVCSWSATTNVASVYNAGTSTSFTGVAYWTTANYSGNRIGCTPQGHGGNLAGTYKLRSHKWIQTACG